jgi:trans-2,3-dihydro-3-hydroxyanthranilate isomerase
MAEIEITGIDHVVVRVADRERALAFYRDALGLRIEREQPELGLVQIRAGRSLIDLVPADVAEARMPNVDHFALEVRGFDERALRAHFESRQVPIAESGLRYGATGEGPSLYVRDPDGNKIELKAVVEGERNSRPDRTYDFGIVDVFATEPLSGNPLVVVAGADNLDEAMLPRIAGEFNQSETTFVLAPHHGGMRRLRSFTAAGAEVVGIGHNALGAWLWLASRGELSATGWQGEAVFLQEIGDHVLPVSVRRNGDLVAITMEQAPARFLSEVYQHDDLACALGLTAADISAAPVVVSTGTPHLLVGVTSVAAVDRAEPQAELLLACLREFDAEGCYVFALCPPEAQFRAYARFFNPTVGLWEDSATGSAAGPLAAYLVDRQLAKSDEEIVIEQGRKIGRPSRLLLRAEGGIVSITGSGFTVAEGRLRL